MAWGDSCKGAFEKWADSVGDKSYLYDNVVKYYKKAMNFTPPDLSSRLANATPVYNPALVSEGGPLDVSYSSYSYSWTTWLAVALQGLGIQNTDSFIKGELNGSAWQMHTINHTTGFRESADRAYLRPYLHRPNLVVFDKTFGEKIVFDSTKRAVGVDVTSGSSSFTLNATREVIVAGGVFQSPQLLQVSGVGSADLLQKHNITVIADRLGVGQNLQEQILFGVSYQVNVPTLSTLGTGENVAIEVEQFNTNATGRLTSPGGEYVGFEKVPQELRSNFSEITVKGMSLRFVPILLVSASSHTNAGEPPSVWLTLENPALEDFPDDWPEIEYLTLPTFVGDFSGTSRPTDSYNYATLLGTLMTPTSRGEVNISSPHMRDPPVINPNYLTTQPDIEVSVAMFKRLRQAWTVPALAKNLTIGDEYYPGASVQTDEDIERLIRSTATPVSHASATCKMGKADDPLAVVDSHGKVYGVSNCQFSFHVSPNHHVVAVDSYREGPRLTGYSVRVVDASAFPFLPPGESILCFNGPEVVKDLLTTTD